MAKKIKIDSTEKNEIKSVLKINDTKTNFEKFKILYENDKELNRKEVGELLGVSRNTIQTYIKKLENDTI